MKPLLIHARPINPATGQRVDVRLGSGATPAYNGLGGFVWEAAVTQRPRLMLDLMSPDLDGQIETGKGELAINVNKIRNLPQDVLSASLVWSGAPIIIYDVSAFDYDAMPVEFTGIVRSGQLDIFTGRLALNLEVDTSRLARPLLFHEFTGSGGNVHNADGGGDPEKRGVLKPAGFGVCKNIEPVWFDETNNVGMLDGYGNLTSVQGLFEGLDDRGASFGNYATYAALVAAAIPPGRWATCNAEGLVRLGAPPAGVITADATFKAVDANIGLPGSLIYDILYLRAGIPAVEMDIASFNALSAAVPRPCHYWTATQRDIMDLTQAIAASCNATLVVLLNGKIAVTRAFGGAIIGALNRDGTSQPPVTDWRAADTISPVWRMRARAARPGRVLDYSEVNYEDSLEDKGSYKTGETYRQGHLVWAPNGAQFLYINATPAAGQPLPVPPATENAHWQQTREPTTAADLVYNDGTSIEALKPAALGADVTAANTAAAIQGQGAFATQNTAGYGSSLLTGFGGLAALGNVYFGSPYLLEASGGSQATIAAFKTALGIASGFTGQGSLATLNGLGYGSPYLTGFGALAPLGSIYFGSPFLLESSGGVQATTTAFKTALGIASAIAGQGSFATISSVGYGSPLLTGFGGLAALGSIYFGSPYLLEASGGVQATVNAFKTALGIASAITGQGSFATVDSAAYGSALLTGFGALAPLGSVHFGSPYLLEASGGEQATVSAFKTALGIASGFTGQGAFATVNSAAFGSPLLTGFGSLAADSLVALGGKLWNETLAYKITDSNAVTSLGTSAGILGQGGLATKSAVAWLTEVTGAGTGKPESFATIGDNLIYNSVLANNAEGWTLASVTVEPGPAGGRVPAFLRMVDHAVGVAQTNRFRVNGATRVFIDYSARFSAASQGVHITSREHDSAGVLITGRFLGIYGNGGAALGAWGEGRVSYVPDPRAAFVEVWIRSWLGAAGTPVDVGAVRASFTERAATLGADINTNLVDGGSGTPTAFLVRSDVRTVLGTAAAIAGQGAFATVNSAAYGSALLTGFGTLAARANVRLGTEVVRADGTTAATEALVITSLGTASGIASQGVLATQNLVSFGPSGVVWNQTLAFRITDSNAVTSLGIAASITSQGALATLSTVAWATHITGTGKPQDNADVTATSQVVVVPPANQSFLADSGGVVSAGQTPRTIAPKVTKGGVDIRTDAGTTYAITATNVAATVDNVAGSATKGQITITGVSAIKGSIDLVVTVGGIAQPAVRTLVDRNDAAPASTGGAGAVWAEDTTLSNVSTTYAAVSNVLTLRAPASGTIALTAPLSFERAAVANGQSGAFGKWQWRAIGGVFADVAAEIANTENARTVVITGEPTEQWPGAINVSQNKTGLTSGTDYEFQLLVRSSSGTISLNGTARATQ